MRHPLPENREDHGLKPARTLIVGAGDESRGDDAAGLLVMEELKRRKAAPLSFRAFRGDAMGLVSSLAEYSAVLIFDAVVSACTPGTIHVFEWRPGTRAHGFRNCSTHSFGIEEALELAAVLGVLPERVVFAGIEGSRFGVGDALSPEVETAIRSLSSLLFVTRCLSGGFSCRAGHRRQAE